MKNALGKLARKIIKDENEKIKFAKFVQMRDHDGWQTFLEWLLYLRAAMAEEMLSDRFSKLEPYEKDVQQRAFNQTDQVILFLLDPAKLPRKWAAYARQQTQQETNRMGKVSERGKNG